MHKAKGKATVKITLAILLSGIALGVSGQTTGTGTGTGTGTSTGTTTTGTTSTTSASLDDQSATMNDLAASKGQTQVANKIAASFAILAGSKENSLLLVNGLRNGNAITLTSVPPTGTITTAPKTGGTVTTGVTGTTVGTSTTTTTTITPPTGKMGWGNVFISLALAQKILTQAGITNPTAAQLNIALNGGELTGADGKTTTVKGVLQLRADGMGWGKIAQVYGTKVGTVVSEIKAANRQLAKAPTIEPNDAGKRLTAHRPDNADKSQLARTKTVSTNGTASTTSATSKSGVITASGTKAGNVGATGITTANGNMPSGKGSGIVTAAGGGAGSSQAATSVRSTGTGLVTATGAASTSATSGLTTAQGGSGHGNGNSNGGKGKGG